MTLRLSGSLLFISPVAALIVLFAGCLGPWDREPEAEADPDVSPFQTSLESSEAGAVFGRPATTIVVEFNVHRYSAPKGTFTSSDASVWSVVTGPLPSAEMTLHLADSGFRAAIGRQSDRMPLTSALEALQRTTELRSAVDQVTPDARREIELEIGPVSWSSLPVFYVQEDGRLAGQDFENAQTKFLMTYAMRAENLREVWVQLVPAIEEPPGPLKWVGTPESGFQQIPEQRRKVFTDVVLATPVPEGGFILLGATETVYDRPYLARPFFIEQAAPEDGESGDTARESIFIISPILRTLSPGLPTTLPADAS